MRQFRDVLDRALTVIGREGTHIRFVVSGTGDGDEGDDD